MTKINKFFANNVEQYYFMQNKLQYHNKYVVPYDLILKLPYQNIHQLPFWKKITVHSTSKSIVLDKKRLIVVLFALSVVCGQKPKPIVSKQAVAAFNLRKSMYISGKVTLRKERLFTFLDKLLFMVLYKKSGKQAFVNGSWNNLGNITLGVESFLFFPEIEEESEKVDTAFGLDVSIFTSVQNALENQIFLSAFQISINKHEKI